MFAFDAMSLDGERAAPGDAMRVENELLFPMRGRRFAEPTSGNRYYGLPAPQVSQRDFQSVERQKAEATRRAQESAQSPEMLAFAAGVLAPLAVPFVTAPGVPAALGQGARSLGTRKSVGRIAANGVVGAGVNGGLSMITDPGDLGRAVGQARNGFVSGLATGVAGAVAGPVSKKARLGAEAAAAYAAAKATGGSDFESAVAAVASGGLTFYNAPYGKKLLGIALGRRAAAALEGNAGQIIQMLEKKTLGAVGKKGVNDAMNEKKDNR
jgi:hypothetical protein